MLDVKYWDLERLDHLRAELFVGVTGIYEQMHDLVQEAAVVRERLLAGRKDDEKHLLTSKLALRLSVREDSSPSVYWFDTANAGPSTNRFARWIRIPIGGHGVPKYKKYTLKRVAASKEEFEECWAIELQAANLREALQQCQKVLSNLDGLEQIMKKISIVTPTEKSTFSKGELLLKMKNHCAGVEGNGEY